MELERIKYVLRCYLKIRIKKVCLILFKTKRKRMKKERGKIFLAQIFF